jgi:hypothetical protein
VGEYLAGRQVDAKRSNLEEKVPLHDAGANILVGNMSAYSIPSNLLGLSEIFFTTIAFYL